jgi:hypothetical protein
VFPSAFAVEFLLGLCHRGLGESGTASLRLVPGVLPSLTVRTPLSIKIVSSKSEARDHTGVLNRTSDPDLGGISHPAPSELMNSGDPDGN